MQKSLVYISMVLVGFATSTGSSAKNLYVSTTGNDATTYEANSASQPWRTLGRAVWGNAARTSPNTAQAARAGDVVIVAAGTYNTNAGTGTRYEPIYNPVNSGTAGSPIVFRSETRGGAILQSSQSTTAQPLAGAMDKSYVTWDGFLLDESNIPTQADTGPFVFWSTNNAVVQNMTIRGFNRGWVDNHNGIRIENSNNVLIRNNDISGYVDSQNNHNSNCVTLYRSSNVTIEHNECYNANGGLHVKGSNPGPVILRNNLIHDITLSAIMFSGIAQATAHNNVVYNAWTGVSYHQYRDETGVDTVTVANNTFVNLTGADGGGQMFRGGSAFFRNIRIYNNITARAQSGVTSWEWTPQMETAVDLAYNAYSQNTRLAEVAFRGQTFSVWQNTYHQDEVGSLETTVSFINETARNYRLPTGSPLLNAGLDILDLNRNGSTTDRVPMGAYLTGSEIIGKLPATRPNPPTDTNAL